MYLPVSLYLFIVQDLGTPVYLNSSTFKYWNAWPYRLPRRRTVAHIAAREQGYKYIYWTCHGLVVGRRRIAASTMVR